MRYQFFISAFLVIMMSTQVFSIDTKKTNEWERSKLICKFSEENAFWTEDRELYKWEKNRPYDEVRSFKLPQSLTGSKAETIYYLAQTNHFQKSLSKPYLTNSSALSRLFISEFSEYDQARLIEHVENKCNVTIDPDNTKKILAEVKAYQSNKKVDALNLDAFHWY